MFKTNIRRKFRKRDPEKKKEITVSAESLILMTITELIRKVDDLIDFLCKNLPMNPTLLKELKNLYSENKKKKEALKNGKQRKLTDF